MPDRGYARPTARSRELRAMMTDAERKLWACLSARKVAGVRFNRQFPAGPFICDFVSRSAKPVIEVDGGQHGVGAERDYARTRFIESQGYRVIRFWNNDVLERLEGVICEIERVLADMPSPSPSRKREGDEEGRPAELPSRLREGLGEGLSKQTEPPCP
ncbi:endonuclease domain-containing protein [Sphingomonas jeddahensis]|nr:endonuclease domain-containing protein [Sphingomonas jeddahensis]